MNTICFIMIMILQHCNEILIGDRSFMVVVLLGVPCNDFRHLV